MIQYQEIGNPDFVIIPETLKAVFRSSYSPYTVGILNEGNRLSRKANRNANVISAVLAFSTFGGSVFLPNLKSHFFNIAIFDNDTESMLGYMTIESSRNWNEPVNVRKLERQIDIALRRMQNKDIARLKRQRVYRAPIVFQF